MSGDDKQSASGFGTLGNTSTLFGASPSTSTHSGIFGQTPNTGFGQQSAGSNLSSGFGTLGNTSTLFGASPSTSTHSGIFGQTPNTGFGQQSAGSNLSSGFGTLGNTSTLFGASPSTSTHSGIFGQTPNTGFGQQSAGSNLSSGFGTLGNTSTLFGASPSTSTHSGIFGQTPNTGFGQQSAGSNLSSGFGTLGNTSTLFGASPSTSTHSGIFGQTPNTGFGQQSAGSNLSSGFGTLGNTSTLFGASPSTSTHSGIFGQTPNTGFGQQSAGSNLSSGFGTLGNTSTLFGASPSTSTHSGIFGQTSNTGFGQQSAGNTLSSSFGTLGNTSTLFGARPSTSTHSGIFGQTPNTGFGQQSGFGSTTQPSEETLFDDGTSGSTFFSFVSQGGTTKPFKPPSGQDTRMIDGVPTDIITKHQCITAMIEYEDKCIEELRLEDYTVNRKFRLGSGFGSTTQPSEETLFGDRTSGSTFFSFVSQGGTTKPFKPPSGQDTRMMIDGVPTDIITKHQCITAMIEYENKCIEELRLEDYTVNRKFRLGSGFGSTTQPSEETLFDDGTSGTTFFSFVSQGGTSKPFKPPSGQDPTDIITKHQASGFGTLGNTSTLFGARPSTSTHSGIFGQTPNTGFGQQSGSYQKRKVKKSRHRMLRSSNTQSDTNKGDLFGNKTTGFGTTATTVTNNNLFGKHVTTASSFGSGNPSGLFNNLGGFGYLGIGLGTGGGLGASNINTLKAAEFGAFNLGSITSTTESSISTTTPASDTTTSTTESSISTTTPACDTTTSTTESSISTTTPGSDTTTSTTESSISTTTPASDTTTSTTESSISTTTPASDTTTSTTESSISTTTPACDTTTSTTESSISTTTPGSDLTSTTESGTPGSDTTTNICESSHGVIINDPSTLSFRLDINPNSNALDISTDLNIEGFGACDNLFKKPVSFSINGKTFTTSLCTNTNTTNSNGEQGRFSIKTNTTGFDNTTSGTQELGFNNIRNSTSSDATTNADGFCTDTSTNGSDVTITATSNNTTAPGFNTVTTSSIDSNIGKNHATASISFSFQFKSGQSDFRLTTTGNTDGVDTNGSPFGNPVSISSSVGFSNNKFSPTKSTTSVGTNTSGDLAHCISTMNDLVISTSRNNFGSNTNTSMASDFLDSTSYDSSNTTTSNGELGLDANDSSSSAITSTGEFSTSTSTDGADTITRRNEFGPLAKTTDLDPSSDTVAIVSDSVPIISISSSGNMTHDTRSDSSSPNDSGDDTYINVFSTNTNTTDSDSTSVASNFATDTISICSDTEEGTNEFDGITRLFDSDNCLIDKNTFDGFENEQVG